MLARLAALSICLGLAACATPATLKERGEHGSVIAVMPVAKAAHCLQTAFENVRYDMQTRLTTTEQDGRELVVRYDYGALAVLAIRQRTAATSTVEYWIDPGSFTPEPPQLIHGMLGRC